MFIRKCILKVSDLILMYVSLLLKPLILFLEIVIGSRILHLPICTSSSASLLQIIYNCGTRWTTPPLLNIIVISSVTPAKLRIRLVLRVIIQACPSPSNRIIWLNIVIIPFSISYIPISLVLVHSSTPRWLSFFFIFNIVWCWPYCCYHFLFFLLRFYSAQLLDIIRYISIDPHVSPPG